MSNDRVLAKLVHVDMMIVARRTLPVDVLPDDGEEVYVVTNDGRLFVCIVDGGRFWPTHYFYLKPEAIRFWFRHFDVRSIDDD